MKPTLMKPKFDSLPWAGKKRIERSVGGSFAAGAALVAMLSLLQPGNAVADDLSASTFVNNTGSPQTQLNLVLNGNVGADIVASLSTFPGATVSSSYNGVANTTTLTFTGTTGIANADSVYLGLDDTVASQIVNSYWGSSPTANQLPGLSVSFPSTSSPGPTKYLIEYVTMTSGGQSVGNWFEVPYTGNFPANYLGNYTTGPETLSNVGFQLSPTLIPLDDLNLSTEPPPGTSGSPFTPLPQYDGSLISAGSTLGVSAPDATSTLGLLSLSLSLVAMRRKA
jgi:hypothetical protein